MADELLVRAEGLFRVFERGGNAIEALKPCSLAIHAGGRIAVVGASGSGKSTLLLLIAGVDKASGGTLTWPALGERGELRPGRLSISFQSASLIPFLTAAANVALPLFVLRASGETDAAAMKALARFGIADLAGKFPAELSGGQAQRVALARAIVTRPNLVVADELTGQLDQDTAQETISELLGWAAETGGSLLIATHDERVAERFDVVWRMEHGRLIAPVAEVA